MATVTEAAAPPSFEWKRWPETEEFVEGLIGAALAGNAFARRWPSGCRPRPEPGSRCGSITWS